MCHRLSAELGITSLFSMRITGVVIDNNACENATVIQVDSVNKHGILLDVVQVISDMNLVIKKAYISSDGVWFMDVFNVTDRNGNKIKDNEVIDYIQRVGSCLFAISRMLQLTLIFVAPSISVEG
ncbi:amino acid binding protein [Trifolium pratense]|uniref:ACT domain-containing protein ACR n=1 Tax=Trifolium pratense TaxID=57577 RepID=A0A2K3N2U2_TRIPR|nr:amino acid binding protein [Trifolium pratense]